MMLKDLIEILTQYYLTNGNVEVKLNVFDENSLTTLSRNVGYIKLVDNTLEINGKLERN